MARQLHQTRLRLIEGGKKEKPPSRDWRHLKSAILPLAVLGVSTAVSAYYGCQGRQPGTASPAQAPIVRLAEEDGRRPEPRLEIRDDRPAVSMESLGNRELIGKLLSVDLHGQAVGPDMSRRVIEHNHASLILEMRGASAVSDVAETMGSDHSEFRRESLAYILGRIGREEGLPALRNASRNDSSMRVRAAADEAIAQIEKR